MKNFQAFARSKMFQRLFTLSVIKKGPCKLIIMLLAENQDLFYFVLAEHLERQGWLTNLFSHNYRIYIVIKEVLTPFMLIAQAFLLVKRF